MAKNKPLGDKIASIRGQKLDDLPVDMNAVYEFLSLLVNIKYREKYGESTSIQKGRGYAKDAQVKVLADQFYSSEEGQHDDKSREDVYHG